MNRTKQRSRILNMCKENPYASWFIKNSRISVQSQPKQYQEVLKKYPLLSELYALTKEFCNVLFSNNPAKLDEWINEAQKYDIPELQTFINGIKKDLTAVKNGIIYSYNNGLAEGSVNKIKVIKRVMYGRNSFELLKAKVLFGELFHVKFN